MTGGGVRHASDSAVSFILLALREPVVRSILEEPPKVAEFGKRAPWAS
jgi:hypothetical protein